MVYVEEHEVRLTKTVTCGDVVETPVDNIRKTTKLAKGKRSKFAMSLAKEAYLKFGRRPVSEANALVTRKWMVKFLEGAEYKDLRTCDKVIAVDRALYLSFVPTIVYNNMRTVAEDKAFVGRVDGSTTSFGRIFSLVGGGNDSK